MPNQNVSKKELRKLAFICNAVRSGWDVSQVDEKTFEFTKNIHEFIPQNVSIHEIQNELPIEQIVSDFVYASLSLNLLLTA